MKNSEIKVLVTGAGGFIGHHLVRYLKDLGYWVRAVDTKYVEHGKMAADEFLVLDMKSKEDALTATKDIEEVYGLAADMGGMGFIAANNAKILHANALMNFNTLDASRINGVKRYFYSSSACIYPEYRQNTEQILPLKEEDAYPAQPQDGYGWEKLMMELLCKYYYEDYGIETRIARFHNIYGIEGTWRGGREKAPAAICRKVAEAKLNGQTSIEIWGDGEQTRSFCYITDCLDGIYKLMRSDYREPMNIGRDELVSINELADVAMKVAGVKLNKIHVEGPQGVRGRNSDNTKSLEVLNWQPEITLEEGISLTYNWIEGQVKNAGVHTPR